MGVDFTRLGGEGHALLAGEVHHRAVFSQAVHEERARAPVARMGVGAREQGAAQAAPALRREHRHAQLGARRIARKVRDAEQLELVVEHAERRAMLEIDALHVGAQRGVAERNAEAQPPVLCSEREKVPLERGALSCGELTDDDFGAHACILRRFLLRDDGECLACNF